MITYVGAWDMIKQKRSNVETNRYTAADINYAIDKIYLYFFSSVLYDTPTGIPFFHIPTFYFPS